jgi:hypothetical protein
MRFLYKILLLIVVIAFTSQSSFAGNNDGILGDQKIRFIQCYPNPATTNISFETNNVSDKSLTLTIYNFIGKKVDEIKLSGNKVNISLDNYYRGLYVYQLRDKQGLLIESGKFQVAK